MTREEAKGNLIHAIRWNDMPKKEALDMAIKALENQTEEEDILKFYYVESEDDYWIGRRLDTLYYAKWHYDIGFVWESSRYLPWGEHVVRPNTLWKEHTYPSEPVEIPFTKWIIGFLKKYYGETLGKQKTGHWIGIDDDPCEDWECDKCGFVIYADEHAPYTFHYCPNCGAEMKEA